MCNLCRNWRDSRHYLSRDPGIVRSSRLTPLYQTNSAQGYISFQEGLVDSSEYAWVKTTYYLYMRMIGLACGMSRRRNFGDP